MIEDAGTPGFRFAAPRAKSVPSSGLETEPGFELNQAWESSIEEETPRPDLT